MSDAIYESDLQYLEDELEWIELRCKRIITKKLVEELSADDEAGVFYNQNYYHHDQTLESLVAKRDALEKKERKLRMRIDSRLSETRQSGHQIAIDQLVELYNLTNFERTMLLLAASVTFSRRFLQLYGRIWQGYEALIVETVFSFAELSFAERIEHLKYFGHGGSLLRHELVQINFGNRIQSPQELLDAQLRISNRTFDFMVGDEHFMDDFMEFSSVEEPRAQFDQVVLADRDKERIRSVVERHDHYLQCRKDWGFDDIISYGKGVLMLFYGKPGTGKTMMAHAVANEMGMRVLNVDIPTFINHYDAQRFLPSLFREAKMQNAILFFDECESLFATRTSGNPLMTLLLTEIERFEGVAILATNLPQQLDEALDRRILVRVGFPEPDRQARRDIWERHLPDAAPIADDVDLDALSEQFEMTGGYIKNAVLMAVAEAVHNGGDSPKITMGALERSAREQTTHSNEESSPVVTPRTRLEDVVLTPAARNKVDELIAASRTRHTVLERLNVGTRLSYGKGTSALLWGPSGTGKTFCAEAISAELNRSLRHVSLAGLGAESMAHLRSEVDRAFQEARTHNAVLLLDHIDSILSGDHDMASWLMSKIEWHDGVVLIVATERPGGASVFTQRVNYVIEMPTPDAEARGAIWKTLLGASEHANVDYAALGEDFELTGGHIKNVALKAAFRAAQNGATLDTELIRQVIAG